MPSTECHSCGIVSQQVMLSDPAFLCQVQGLAAPLDVWTAPFSCANCKQLNIGTVMTHATSAATHPQETARQLMRDQDARLDWKPKRLHSPEYPYTPPQIASAAAEAHQCHSVDAYRAATILARAVIEATAKDHKITTGGIQAKIKAMNEAGLLRPLHTRQAHMIRSFGNDMAHGDFDTEIDQTASAYILTLMDSILHEVYVSPGEFEHFENIYSGDQDSSP
jgi:hypothetical protein